MSIAPLNHVTIHYVAKLQNFSRFYKFKQFINTSEIWYGRHTESVFHAKNAEGEGLMLRYDTLNPQILFVSQRAQRAKD